MPPTAAHPCSGSMASVSSVTDDQPHSPWRTRSAPPERPYVMTSSLRSPLEPPPEPIIAESVRSESLSVTTSSTRSAGGEATPWLRAGPRGHLITSSAALSAGIYGIGAAVPERVLTNADLEKRVETSDEWIVSRTGISERRIVAEGQATSDLAAEAARR